MPAAAELPDLRPNDFLGRSVFSSGQARRAERRAVPHHVFLELEEAESLSVNRLDHASDTVMAEIGDNFAILRGRNFYGWATVTVEEGSRDGREVAAAPLSYNLYHAEIYLNVPEDAERRDRQVQHATDLATAANWRPRP